jgi:hypothetical protein
VVTTLDRRASAGPISDLDAFRLSVFARMLALAALFHLAGNARDALVTSLPLALASVLLGAAAAATLLSPERRGNLVALVVGVLLTAWYEAPVVGNHWVLAAALGGVLLLAVVLTRGGAGGDPGPVAASFLPSARLVLLVAYSFAAFAKLNTGFLDPAVSCAVYFHEQLVQSWGLGSLSVAGSPGLGRAIAVAAVVTELSVALLLAVPATRRVGLVLAVGFHWLLAMDLAQHFWDFSSVLFAAFLLFLDEGQVAQAREWGRRLQSRLGRWDRITRSAVRALATLVVVLAVAPLPEPYDAVLVVLGHLGWWFVDTGTVVLVLALALAPRGRRVSLRPPAAVLYVVPALVLLNGLTPYLEVKTGWGWNMYSNLRTVAGESNHLLVPTTLDLTGLQRDQVRIIDSSHPALQQLSGSGYVMAYSEFREFAHAHPDAAVTYERGGRAVHVDRLADDPAGQGGVSALSVRLQSFRVIDATPAERCQPTFSAAR